MITTTSSTPTITEADVDTKIATALSAYPSPTDIATDSDLNYYVLKTDFNSATTTLQNEIDNISASDDVTQADIDALFT